MYIGIEGLGGENYTNVTDLFEPLLWAFYLDAKIQLITNTCESGDRGFGSFSIVRLHKSVNDVLAKKTKIKFIPIKL